MNTETLTTMNALLEQLKDNNPNRVFFVDRNSGVIGVDNFPQPAICPIVSMGIDGRAYHYVGFLVNGKPLKFVFEIA